jgi:hypothetical protein
MRANKGVLGTLLFALPLDSADLARARNVIAAVLKRLAHRNPNVQLYALALGEALSKNCGAHLHREMASRSFTQGLEKLVTDRVRCAKPRTTNIW